MPALVTMDATVTNTAITAVTQDARPSSPSVKFEPFTVPQIAIISTGTAKIPRDAMKAVPPAVKSELKGILISNDIFVR